MPQTRRQYRPTRTPGSALRPLRGLAIASAGGIVARGGGVFTVPSQSAQGAMYQVEFREGRAPSCGCKDWKTRRRKRACKHGEAAQLALRAANLRWDAPGAGEVLRALVLDGAQRAELDDVALYREARRNPVLEPQFPTGTATFRTRQKKAARIMRERLPRMLHELVLTEEQARPRRRGPHGLLLHQRAFCVLMRVFENRPLADVCHALNGWSERGLLPDSPRVNTLCHYMHDAELDGMFERISHRIARTVRHLERAVVMDSSALSTIWSANYLDTHRGQRVYRSQNRWLKVHVAAGPVSNVVSGIFVTWNKRGDQTDISNPTADVNFFLPLLDKTLSRGWTPVAAAADKGYFDERHFTEGRAKGVHVFIPMKRNTTAAGKSRAMVEMLELYDERPEEFDAVYNAIRPKIEGVFSAAKRTTGDYLWSKGELLPEDATDEQLVSVGRSRWNETLGKFIVHSLRQLVLLECMHDEAVHFASDRAFEPFAEEAKVMEEVRGEMREDERDDHFGDVMR